MSTTQLRPITLVGIRRLANRKKKELGIKHSAALDQASIDAGYANYRDAKRALKDHTTDKHYILYITAGWKNPDSGESGRERLELPMSAPWDSLIRADQLYHRNFNRFEGVSSDHFAATNLYKHQSNAREEICEVARIFQFMEATGLRPSKGHSRGRVEGRFGGTMPGLDHISTWFDPETKRYLMVDEPYEPAIERIQQQRSDWAVDNGYELAKPDWRGMYAPAGNSRLYLISKIDKGVLLAPVIETLNLKEDAIVADPWPGVSESLNPRFISPATRAKAKVPDTPRGKRRERKLAHGKTVPFSYWGIKSRRPAVPMSLDGHQSAAAGLASILQLASNRAGIKNRVNSVRSELDEWVVLEYSNDELSDEAIYTLYYQSRASSFPKKLTEQERLALQSHLDQVKATLLQGYADCAPLRNLIHKLEMAEKSLHSWR